MDTAAGTHSDVSTVLSDLLALEHDTQAAFESAMGRVQSATYRGHLADFLANQRQHIAQLTALARHAPGGVVPGSDAKQVLLRGVVMLANLAGDRAVLQALSQSLDDLNVAYAQAVTHDGMPPAALGVLQGHFLDERRHRGWLHRCLSPEALDDAADETDAPAALAERTGPHPIDLQPPQAR